MKNLEKLTNIIESIVFVSGNAIAIKDIADKLEVEEKYITHAINKLKEKYSNDSGIHLLEFNKKLQFSSNTEYAEEVSSVLNPIKERELSRSLLETASIIAYKQPVTRIDLEQIRGNSEYAVQKLLELKIIEPVGRKDAVGKPILYGTTDEFLKRFQISSLDELPDYEELLDKITSLHANEDNNDYLYKKDEYIEPDETNVAESVAVTEDSDKIEIEKTKVPKIKKVKKSENDDNFELPPIDKEEIPDFLKGEDIQKL